MHRIHNNLVGKPKEFVIPPTLCSRALQFVISQGQKKKTDSKKKICMGKWSAVAHVNSHQRSLPTTQAHYPTTEDTAGFCLLCCQPEPVPLSLSTRTSQLTPCCPCGVPTWSGQAINVARRTWGEHIHFTNQLPLGWQEGATLPSCQVGENEMLKQMELAQTCSMCESEGPRLELVFTIGKISCRETN